MIRIDFVPKDGKLCENCIWGEKCPYDYTCETFERNFVFEEYNNVRDGDSA